MLAKFTWLQQIENPLIRLRPLPRKATSAAHRLIILITLLFAGWLAYRLLWRPLWPQQIPLLLQELLLLSEIAGLVTLASVWALIWWRRSHPSPVLIPAVDIETLYALSPRDFEIFVAQLFRKKGYRVRHRGRSGDMGVDLEVVQQGGKLAVVQCKRYRSTIGPEVVRELYGTLIHEKAAHAFLVTTADISESAREWAQGKPMTLIDGETLAQVTAVLSRSSS